MTKLLPRLTLQANVVLLIFLASNRQNFRYLPTKSFKQVTGGISPSGICSVDPFTVAIMFFENFEFGDYPPIAICQRLGNVGQIEELP